MNPDQARELMRKVLRPIAPEADLNNVLANERIQEALDLDSVDFLEFVTGLSAATGLEMPERDYAQLSTVEGCIDYLTSPH